MKRLSTFILGMLFAVACFFIGGYVVVTRGWVRMDTSAPPLPYEKRIAHTALRANMGAERDRKSPLAADEANMTRGAGVYKEHCAVCHGTPAAPRTAISKGMFPVPPQLLEKDDMVTDDPEGETYWKVTHGIRLTGMPAFGAPLSDDARWQVTLLVKHADTMSPGTLAALR